MRRLHPLEYSISLSKVLPWTPNTIAPRMYTRLPENDVEESQQSPECLDLIQSSWNVKKCIKTTRIVLLSSLLVATCGLVAILMISANLPSRSCSNPTVRKEWRQLNASEKSNYISAVKCLQKHPSKTTGVGRLSDDFPWLHRRVNKYSRSRPGKRLTNSNAVHQSALFLPWHRYLLHLYEEYLRQLCKYSGPLPCVSTSLIA